MNGHMAYEHLFALSWAYNIQGWMPCTDRVAHPRTRCMLIWIGQQRTRTSFLVEISVRSPRNFVFSSSINVFSGSKYPKRFYLILKTEAM